MLSGSKKEPDASKTSGSAFAIGYWFTRSGLSGCVKCSGKRKLCPNVSPNKSVEGAAAGFIGCLAVMVYLGVKVLDMEIVQAAALGLCVAVFAPLGDLVESILKRSFGVKDSGKIFPGHGGVLDRCDSLLFAIPLGYYVLVFSVLLTKTH